MQIGIKRAYLLQNGLKNLFIGIKGTISGCLMHDQRQNHWFFFAFFSIDFHQGSDYGNSYELKGIGLKKIARLKNYFEVSR